MDTTGLRPTNYRTSAFGDFLDMMLDDATDEVYFVSLTATSTANVIPYRVAPEGPGFKAYFGTIVMATVLPDPRKDGEWIIFDANAERLPGTYRPGEVTDMGSKTLPVARLIAAILEDLTRQARIVG